MKKTLFVINAPIGDIINFSCILKDYHEMFQDEELYVITGMKPFLDVFKNNSIVKLYDENIKYDKILHYDLAKFDQSEGGIEKLRNIKNETKSIQDTPYLYFKYMYNIDIPHKNYIPCIELDETQKKHISNKKPICLINGVAQYFMMDARYFGYKKYQQIINDFKDKIDFISIGNLNYNMLRTIKFENVVEDLVNKTSLYDLLHYIYNADIILTHESGIYHLVNIESYKERHVIVPAGARQSYKMNNYKTPNVKVYWVENMDLSFYQKNCYKDDEKRCMICPLISKLNDIEIAKDNFCKAPILNNGELLSHCMNNISVEQIEEVLNKCI